MVFIKNGHIVGWIPIRGGKTTSNLKIRVMSSRRRKLYTIAKLKLHKRNKS